MMNARGFIDGQPDWKVFLQCPVSRRCSVYIATTGEVGTAEIDRIIENLVLVRSGFETHEVGAEDSPSQPTQEITSENDNE